MQREAEESAMSDLPQNGKRTTVGQLMEALKKFDQEDTAFFNRDFVAPVGKRSGLCRGWISHLDGEVRYSEDYEDRPSAGETLMACREKELIAALRAVVRDGDVEYATRLLAEIDEEEEALRQQRNPYGDYDGSDG